MAATMVHHEALNEPCLEVLLVHHVHYLHLSAGNLRALAWEKLDQDCPATSTPLLQLIQIPYCMAMSKSCDGRLESERFRRPTMCRSMGMSPDGLRICSVASVTISVR